MNIRKLILQAALFGLCVSFGWSTALSQTAAPATEKQAPAQAGASAKPAPKLPLPASLSASEWAKLCADLSEAGGFFRSDNFTSNETSYLHIVEKLRQHGTTGGAYLGVGPEQNFTYIAKLKPQIVFLLDIRRQAIIQHLMYKALFRMSATRGEFLARLLSKKVPSEKELTANASLNEIIAYCEKTTTDEKLAAEYLTAIRKLIVEEFKFSFSEEDNKSLEYVHSNFRTDGLEIAYRMSGNGQWGYNIFPTLKEILTGTDLKGVQGGFLASVADYEFVRELHRKNLIVHVVGNFGGPKAIAGIGEYLKQHGTAVNAFYLSNVEQYLFQDELFDDFANNVRKLPLTDKSLFIRAITGRGPHPARLPGHRLATLAQQMTIFLKDFDAGNYPTYFDLISTHYIMADQP